MKITNMPVLSKKVLNYVFEDMETKHIHDTLWLEFGVASGNSINYISGFTKDKVYGFDSFEGLPEKWREGYDAGAFSRNGELPRVNDNVILIKGLFNKTLENFLKETNKKISFMHIDCDLYSSTKYILELTKDYLCDECILVFDELINYEGFQEGELKALEEYLEKYDIKYEWIGSFGESAGLILM